LIVKQNDILWGKYSYGVILTNGADVRVGRFCSIASGVTALVYLEHRPDWITTYPFGNLLNVKQIEGDVRPQNNRIIVENDVWIGKNVTLLENTILRNGCIVGSNAVVHGEIPPYSIAVGNPAKVIRKRFSDEQIEALLKIQWWDWDTEKITEYSNLLCSSKIDEFIKKVQENEQI